MEYLTFYEQLSDHQYITHTLPKQAFLPRDIGTFGLQKAWFCGGIWAEQGHEGEGAA